MYEGRPAYRTGDHGHEEEGHLFYDGRTHGLVKVRGNRIELGDVEANLRALEGILQAVVLVREGPSPALLGFVQLDGPHAQADLALSNQYRARLQERGSTLHGAPAPVLRGHVPHDSPRQDRPQAVARAPLLNGHESP